ncbi:MAG: HAD family phosphatase [Rhodobacteraceae bacterium]|nr:HAD family phosphatase [Paracoccaceae bacterium]
MTIDAVIFDIGNVLIEWQPERFYDAEVGLERRRAMFAEVDLHGMNDEVDRGGHFQTTVYAWAERYPDYRDEIRMWHDRWLELATPRIEPSIAILRALRERGVPVYALSNFGIESFALAEEHFDFLSEFDRRFISGHMGVTKPDPAIYAMVEAETGLAPGRLLFVDDKPENIAAAAARDWQTHLFDGPAGWAARLEAEGLLPQPERAAG